MTHYMDLKANRTCVAHRSKGFDVKITAKEVSWMFITAEYCPICGVLMVDEADKRDKIHRNKVKTLDRKYNEIEMRKDNVQVICFACNTRKGTKAQKE